MELVVVLVGLPVAWLLGMAGYAYYDAERHGLDPQKWAAVSFFLPIFGFFAYIFERDERRRDPEDEPDMTTKGPFRVHESRAEESMLGPADSRESAEPATDDPDRRE